MLWYTGRRLLQLIPVFFGATFLIYFMVWPILPHPLSSALLQSAACLIVLHQGLEVCLPRPPVYQLASIAFICIVLPPPGDSGVLQPPACSWESNVGSRVRGV